MTPSGTPAPQDPELEPAFEPEDVRYIGDVETLRAISDATRMRILETMVQRRSPGWSVKELAAALQLPQTRLYHHIELLTERDLIRPVERRVVSGIIETRYAAAALSFQLDRTLFAGDTEQGLAVLDETLRAVFDTARNEVAQAVRAGVLDTSADSPPSRRLMLQRGLTSLTPDRAEAFRERLAQLVEEFGNDAVEEGSGPYGLVLAVYPMPPTDSLESPDADKEPTDG